MKTKIEVKNIKINKSFSQETVCFKADVYVDNVKVAWCKNDGNGGNTNYGAYSEDKQAILAKVEAYAKTLPAKKFQDFELDSSLENIIDDAVDNEFNQREKASASKKIDKLTINNIVFGPVDKSYYKSLGFGKYTLEQVMKSTNGPAAMEKLITRVKSEMKPNEIIFNNNLEKLGIII